VVRFKLEGCLQYGTVASDLLLPRCRVARRVSPLLLVSLSTRLDSFFRSSRDERRLESTARSKLVGRYYE